MRTVTTRDFHNSSAAVLDAVEAGETIIVSRNGVNVAEVRPTIKRRTFVPLTELLVAFGSRPGGDSYAKFRADQDSFFGDESMG
jgi:antitoxin (DNA-binding transcriptional repressor) of toxin-antitoxin stability system